MNASVQRLALAGLTRKSTTRVGDGKCQNDWAESADRVLTRSRRSLARGEKFAEVYAAGHVDRVRAATSTRCLRRAADTRWGKSGTPSDYERRFSVLFEPRPRVSATR